MKLGSKRQSSKDVCMTVPPNGLNAKLDWFAVTDCLGLYRDSQALPQRTACLQCGSVEHLALFEDFEGGGAWGWCLACAWAGDMIDLMALAPESSRGAALQRLMSEGV